MYFKRGKGSTVLNVKREKLTLFNNLLSVPPRILLMTSSKLALQQTRNSRSLLLHSGRHATNERFHR
jgi:hypothetical protein